MLEDTVNVRHHIVGGGIAGLSAAVFLCRDAGVRGEEIQIYEQLNVCGGVIAPPFSKGMRKKNFLGRMNEEIPMKKTRFTEAQIMDLP
jgi:myosin-crossreactive antigen